MDSRSITLITLTTPETVPDTLDGNKEMSKAMVSCAFPLGFAILLAAMNCAADFVDDRMGNLFPYVVTHVGYKIHLGLYCGEFLVLAIWFAWARVGLVHRCVLGVTVAGVWFLTNWLTFIFRHGWISDIPESGLMSIGLLCLCTVPLVLMRTVGVPSGSVAEKTSENDWRKVLALQAVLVVLTYVFLLRFVPYLLDHFLPKALLREDSFSMTFIFSLALVPLSPGLCPLVVAAVLGRRVRPMLLLLTFVTSLALYAGWATVMPHDSRYTPAELSDFWTILTTNVFLIGTAFYWRLAVGDRLSCCALYEQAATASDAKQ